MDSNQERMPIAHNVRNILKLFRTVATSFNHEIDSRVDHVEPSALRELLLNLDNETIRFKMWAGNLAAHQSGPASLDHRLREAPHIQEQVLYLLRDISESLDDAGALISHKGNEYVEDKPETPPESSDLDSEDIFTDSDLDDDDDNISPKPGLSRLVTDIAEATDCLLRLSAAIANPAPHERFRKLGAGPNEDISFYNAHDVRYVQDKFPKISQDLPDVLGKFITRRRQFFKYREAHHAKLAVGLDQETQKDTGRTEIVPNTVASSLPEHFKGSGVIDEDSRSDMAMSETSYATSAGYLMLEDGEMKPAPPLKVPPRPTEADKGVFECPFCYRMISASTRGAWKRHVFGDLRPYTCLFSRCAGSNTDFDRRHRWQLHVSQYHWRIWSCPFKCGSTFQASDELGDHIRHQHLTNASDEHLSTVVARGEVSISKDVTQECPLCRQAISGLKSYIKHVGRHLEQLALHALPKIGDEELEDGAESGEQNDEASELGAVSVDDNSETSSQYKEKSDTNETNKQVESSNPKAGTVGQDGEKDANSGEAPDADTPMPPAASTTFAGEPTVEPPKAEDEAIAARAKAMLETESKKARDAIELEKKVDEEIMAGLEEYARSVDEAPIGSKEQEPHDPSEETGSAVQQDRPVYTRFARKHLSLETLREFNINFDFDADPEYVLVKRWVPEAEQDRMWVHTKIIREKRAETLLKETPDQRGEPQYEWVRKKGGRRVDSPPPFLDHEDRPLHCGYDGCERVFASQYNLQRHLKHFHDDDNTTYRHDLQSSERNTSPYIRSPSYEDNLRILVRATNRESGTAPSPPQPLLRIPTIERDVVTHYRDIDYATSSNPPEERPASELVTYYWDCRVFNLTMIEAIGRPISNLRAQDVCDVRDAVYQLPNTIEQVKPFSLGV
ncbi:transcription factor Cys6 [Fusarium mexicanum]|uniref:Transcription factor Cys6 n=1 Tax=Fusarium mexicanum TaxID=751941 RepID=A0A8H5N7I6_9HYPO|nr:transcription factor Cys6 [Fusarium mexicanum]